MKIKMMCAAIAAMSVLSARAAETTSGARGAEHLYENLTAQTGIPTNLKSMITGVFDFNNDALPDLYFIDWNSEPAEIHAYLNLGGYRFQELKISGLALHKYAGMKLARGLFEPGKIGAVVRHLQKIGGAYVPLQYYTVALQGTDELVFSPIAAARFDSVAGPVGDFQFLDVDRNGRLDIAVGMYYSERAGAKLYEADGLRLLRGNAAGSAKLLQDATQAWGLYTAPGMNPQSRSAPTPTYDLSVCDIAGTDRPALLVGSYGRRWDKLFLNDGSKFANASFSLGNAGDANDLANFRGNGNSFAPVCADADNDGKIDILQTAITHKWAGPTSDKTAIFWNSYPQAFARDENFPRPGAFENQGDISGAWGDVDLDGWQDAMISDSDYPPETKLLLWRQKSARKFENAADWLGEDFINPKGAVFVDLNRSGALDIVSSSSPQRGNGAPFARIYRNRIRDLHPELNWIEVVLRTEDASIPEYPIGAKVRVTGPDGVKQMRELATGYGSDSQISEILHFGLGSNPAKTVAVSVTWPNGQVSALTLEPNRRYWVTKRALVGNLARR